LKGFLATLSSSQTIPPVEPKPEAITQFQDPRTENPPWSLLDVLVIFVFAFFTLLVLGAIALGVAKSLPVFRDAKPVDLAQNALIIVPVQSIAYLLVILFMVMIVRSKHKDGFLKSISWNPPRAEKVLLAVIGGAGLALFSEIFAGLTSRWVPKSLPIENYFRDATSSYLLALFGITFAPFVEELFFRGFLYPALARRSGMASAVVLTAAAFAVLHQSQLAHAWVPLTWLFLVGAVLTLVRAKSRSVALSVAIHFGYNLTLFALVFIGTHGFRHMEHA